MFKKISNERLIDLSLVAVCSLLIISIGIGILALPKYEFSEQENRLLSPAPAPTLASLWDGELIGELSSFYCDHIPLRKELILTNSICELSLGKQLIGDVAAFRNGTLVPRCEYSDLSLLKHNLYAVSSLPESTVVCILPRSVDVLGLPSISTFSENARSAENIVMQSGLDKTCVRDAVLSAHERGEYLFYRTDHHLTTHGAFVVYESLAQSLGYLPLSREDFEISTVSNSFYGTSYSRAGGIPCKADSVELYRYNEDDALVISCCDKGCSVSSLYDMSALDTKDKYRVFLGGNHSLLTVKSDTDKPSLLIIKDSFANALIPFLSIHYNVTAIDPRYADFSIKEYISSHNFDAILLLCGTDTLATDRSFARLGL